MDDLGTLSPVGVRDVWSGESREFTPWLAENADLLGEALGMDLAHEQTEAPVGRYSADLVFREASRDELVVVENMFGPTDHDHLGKLITYAAGLGASYAVLISPEFRDEHRSALTWPTRFPATISGSSAWCSKRGASATRAPRGRAGRRPYGGQPRHYGNWLAVGGMCGYSTSSGSPLRKWSTRPSGQVRVTAPSEILRCSTTPLGSSAMMTPLSSLGM